MSLPNIAITGLMRAGKDAVAAYLCERYGYTRFAFGDELKRYAHELFDVSAGANERSKPRELYQWFGQTMRQRDPDIWVRKCFEDICWFTENYAKDEYIAQSPPPIVITDLRQPSEYGRCRAEGYVIIRVTAPEGLRIQRAIDANDTFTYAELAHETESYVKDFAVDYEIENGGTLAELHARIDEVMTEINGKRAK